MIASETNETIDTIFKRKSVRHFTGKAVPAETLTLLVKAGMAAPSAANAQPWEFIVVTKRDILDTIGNALPYAKMLFAAGGAILVCGTPEKAHRHFTEYAVIDAALASQNILLAAESLHLGSLWVAVYPYPERLAPIRQILNIPETVIPVSLLPIGYPTGEDVPKDKFQERLIHRELW
jgi:nitroreductase